MTASARPQLVELTRIAEIRKNARQTLRITIDQYNGFALVGVRVWERNRAGALRPTKIGVSCRVELLPELAHAVDQALAEAERRQLIIGSDYRRPPEEQYPAYGAGSYQDGPAAKPTISEPSGHDTRKQLHENLARSAT